MSDYQNSNGLSIELFPVPTADKITEIYLSLQLKEEWIDLLNGRVRYGFKGGKLQLKLQESEIVNINSTPSPFKQISNPESVKEVIWELENPNRQICFQQTWENINLGSFKINNSNYQISVSFNILPSDISITTSEGLWKHDITPNKHAILERKIALFLNDQKLKGSLSRVIIGNNLNQIEATDDSNYSVEALTEIEETIKTIYNSSTNNLIELSELANLDPLVDLAGGNLVATNLSGIQISKANLAKTQLRGADLTDADLSEANLSYARLGGADLTGAYLGNSNLQYTDLHRASLALANLIGADLTGADLRETNLINANLSGAQVSGAVFDKNNGLSPEQKLNLKARGAIFI